MSNVCVFCQWVCHWIFSWYVQHCPMMSVKWHILQPRNLADWSCSAKAIIPFQLNPSNRQICHSISLLNMREKHTHKMNKKSTKSFKSVRIRHMNVNVQICVQCDLRSVAMQIEFRITCQNWHIQNYQMTCAFQSRTDSTSNNRQSRTICKSPRKIYIFIFQCDLK